MPSFRPKPPIVRPDYGHPILRGQTCWFCANDKSLAPVDVLQGAFAATLVKTGVTFSNCAWGSAWSCDGSATGSGTGYVDLGSTNRFLPSDTTPFTVAWVEHATIANATGGVASFFPTGAAKQFMILRTSQDVFGVANYGRLSVGPWAATGRLSGFLLPPHLSDKLPLFFVVTGAGGTASQTPAQWKAWWSGSQNGNEVASQSGNAANLGSTANSLGWDNADAKFPGSLDNFRVWSRVLSDDQIKTLLQEPYVGAMRAPNPVLIRFRRGLLSGNVVAGGTPIVGATVRAKRPDGRIVDATVTDGSGNFDFASNQIDIATLHDVEVVGPSGYDSWIHQGITPGGS